MKILNALDECAAAARARRSGRRVVEHARCSRDGGHEHPAAHALADHAAHRAPPVARARRTATTSSTRRWPEADAAALVQDEIELVVQVNGKKRGDIRVPREAPTRGDRSHRAGRPRRAEVRGRAGREESRRGAGEARQCRGLTAHSALALVARHSPRDSRRAVHCSQAAASSCAAPQRCRSTRSTSKRRRHRFRDAAPARHRLRQPDARDQQPGRGGRASCRCSRSCAKGDPVASAGGRVREFQLRYRVRYLVLRPRQDAGDRARRDRAARATISFNDQNQLPKETEEQLLYRDMQIDAAQQLVRRLQPRRSRRRPSAPTVVDAHQHRAARSSTLATCSRSTPSSATRRCSRSRRATASARPRARPATPSARCSIADAGLQMERARTAPAASQSLFATRRLLELRIPTGKPGTEGSAALQRYCAKLPAGHRDARAAAGLDWRTQKSGWFEALDAAGVVVEARVDHAQGAARNGSPGGSKRRSSKPTPRRSTSSPTASKAISWPRTRKCRSSRSCFRPARSRSSRSARRCSTSRATTLQAAARRCSKAIRCALVRMIDGLEGEGAAPPLVLWALAEEIRAHRHDRSPARRRAGRVAALVREARIRGLAHQKLDGGERTAATRSRR